MIIAFLLKRKTVFTIKTNSSTKILSDVHYVSYIDKGLFGVAHLIETRFKLLLGNKYCILLISISKRSYKLK